MNVLIILGKDCSFSFPITEFPTGRNVYILLLHHPDCKIGKKYWKYSGLYSVSWELSSTKTIPFWTFYLFNSPQLQNAIALTPNLFNRCYYCWIIDELFWWTRLHWRSPPRLIVKSLLVFVKKVLFHKVSLRSWNRLVFLVTWAAAFWNLLAYNHKIS